MAFGDIPVRVNDIDSLIDASWFNSVRSELINAFGTGGYIQESALQTLSAGAEVTASTTTFKEMIPVVGNAGPITLSTTPFGSPHSFSAGREILLLGTDDTNTVTIPVNDAADGFLSNEDLVLEKGTLALLVWSDELSRWVLGAGAGGKSAIGQHESLGNGDGLTVDFSVSFLPLTDDSFIIFRNGTKVQRSEYTFSNPTITFNTAPAAGQVIEVFILTEGSPSTIISTGTEQVEYNPLSATEITNKEVTLAATPVDVTKVKLWVINGSAQRYGTDFSVSGTTLTWNGLGLDGQLNEFDVLMIVYFA